jgi:hypothetical protein
MSLKNKVASEATEALEQQVANLGAQSIGVDTDVSKLADLQKLIDNASVSPRQFENDGLTDSAIAGPGAVATPINLSTMKDPAKLAQVDAAIPLGRMARPEEVADVAGFLAGHGASYLTATTISADGGIMHGSVGL